MVSLSYKKVAYELLEDLDPRTQNIVQKRFGFEIPEPLTLESIGRHHSITRERVRQIVEDALSSIKTKIREKRVKGALWDIFDHFVDTLKKSGHMKREDLLLQSLGSPDSFAYIVFLLHLGDQFLKHKETDEVHQFWATNKEVVKDVVKILKDLLSYFEKKNDALALEELHGFHPTADSSYFASILEVSKHMAKAHDGKWGLKRWPHVHPKTIREKAFLALKLAGKPLHFREVTKHIDEFQKKVPGLKVKKILPQTVHNELIKDKRFVLVGRGTYGLADWGYKKGTVKDVIKSLLKENGGKMTKSDIMKRTLSQRKVKESTIVMNLQDPKTFARDELGRYYMR